MEWIQEIEAVAFDIDGTIYPNRAMYRVSLPIVLTHLRLFHAFGRARRVVREHPPKTDLRATTVEITARIMGRGRDSVERLIESVVYRRWERALTGVKMYPGVAETLAALRENGYRVGALSDFPVRTKLELFGIAELWDAVLSSEETGYLKPHAEPFRRIARMLGTEPTRILYVGNSYRYDVIGARAFGMRTAHLVARPPRHSVADLSIRGWEELAAVLLTK